MLTLLGTYILAIAVGAGAALIHDLFFFTSLKHHRLSRHETVTLKQLNNIQLFLILWMVLVEITFFAIQVQQYSISTLLGMALGRLVIEIVVLIALLIIRQIYFPTLIRYQQRYGHLSDSFGLHSNELIVACATSLIGWFYIILITSATFESIFTDFGFVTTLLTFVVTAAITSLILVHMKNTLLHPKKEVKRNQGNRH
jgi:hypothetical protein